MPQNNPIKCIIIEDEVPATTILALHIAQLPILQLVGTFSSAALAFPAIQSGEVDLVFLDINLPGVSGIDFAKSLNLSPSTDIIFTTAYPQYAVEGFNLDAIDYLLKPISFERFTKAVNRYLKYTQQNEVPTTATNAGVEKQFVFVKCERKMVKLFVEDILYLEAQRNYLLIFTKQEVYKAYQSISDMEGKLPEHLFIRTHRSFIVSLDKVERYTSNHVVIHKKEIPIGRLYHKTVGNLLKSMK